MRYKWNSVISNIFYCSWWVVITIYIAQFFIGYNAMFKNVIYDSAGTLRLNTITKIEHDLIQR